MVVGDGCVGSQWYPGGDALSLFYVMDYVISLFYVIGNGTNHFHIGYEINLFPDPTLGDRRDKAYSDVASVRH